MGQRYLAQFGMGLACLLCGAAGSLSARWLSAESVPETRTELVELQPAKAERAAPIAQGQGLVAADIEDRLSALEQQGTERPVLKEEPTTPEPNVSPAQARRTVEAHAAEMSSQHVQEPRDARWTSALQRTLASFATTDGTLRELQVDCRETLCRVDFTHSNLDAVRALLEPAYRAEALPGAMLLVPHERAATSDIRTEMWLARPGAELPELTAKIAEESDNEGQL